MTRSVWAVDLGWNAPERSLLTSFDIKHNSTGTALYDLRPAR